MTGLLYSIAKDHRLALLSYTSLIKLIQLFSQFRCFISMLSFTLFLISSLHRRGTYSFTLVVPEELINSLGRGAYRGRYLFSGTHGWDMIFLVGSHRPAVAESTLHTLASYIISRPLMTQLIQYLRSTIYMFIAFDNKQCF